MLRLFRTAASLEFITAFCLIAPATLAFPQASALSPAQPAAAPPTPSTPRPTPPTRDPNTPSFVAAK